jgi:hypothetical protein
MEEKNKYAADSKSIYIYRRMTPRKQIYSQSAKEVVGCNIAKNWLCIRNGALAVSALAL